MENREQKNGDTNTITLLGDLLVKETRNLLSKTKTEEDLRIGFEKLLEPIKNQLGIRSEPVYEKSVFMGQRSDALHGQVVIEYEKQGSFVSKSKIEHSYDQLKEYMSGESKNTDINRLAGVGFDGEKIFFVRYRGLKSEAIDKSKFMIFGPYAFTPETASTFLIYLRALSRPALTADNLARKFGSESKITHTTVLAFINALEDWGERTYILTFFNEWKRIFGIVYGEHFAGEEKILEFARTYKIPKEINFQELLFAIHTYFALLMKLIAVELITLRDTSLSSSFVSELANLSDDELKRKLEEIEDGGIYTNKGITNFLEGDFFRWYLDAFDSPELCDAVREVARALSEFEPATSVLDPLSTRDLLKKLYQYLVPQEVRHNLGEYYTPDWLAELLLNETDYNGNNFTRLLDPACGSGTFLVLAIQRAKEWGLSNGRPLLEIAKSIKENIWGFDLNPLAVIAARTNYLFALGELVDEVLNKGGEIEIPIYLADSILWPEQVRGLNLYGGPSVKVKTSVGEFEIPAVWVKDKGFLIKKAAILIEKFVKGDFKTDIAMKHLREEGLAFPPFEKIIEKFYEDILELEKQKRNGIWARFLKNLSAPMLASESKFDFVIGNPPWIRWGYLSEDYRKATYKLWVYHGLFPKTQNFASRRLGGGEKDFSMLFLYASADYYLKDNGKLGFLVTQEVFKSKGAGEGFRRFQLGDGQYLKVLKAHDLVSIQPFEGATNKTTAIILKKGDITKYPVPYFVWTKKKGVGKIATDKLLNEISPLLQRRKYSAKPIGSSDKPIGSCVGAWQTRPAEFEELLNIEGNNNYRARRGGSTEPYGVFWLEIRQVLSDGNVIIRNLVEEGKRTIKPKEAILEPDLVYPAARGADIKRWYVDSKIYVLIPYPFSSRSPYTEIELKQKYPWTYTYLADFKTVLVERAAFKKLYQPARKPFYSQYNIQDYSFAKYKVLWRRMANDIIASVVSQLKTQFGYKIIIGTDTTSLFAANTESEAHYLCAIINSKPVRDFIKSFSSAGRGFGAPSIMEHIGIPKFDSENPLHKQLSELSKKCHQLKLEGKDSEIENLEKENEELVKNLFKKNDSLNL